MSLAFMSIVAARSLVAMSYFLSTKRSTRVT